MNNTEMKETKLKLINDFKQTYSQKKYNKSLQIISRLIDHDTTNQSYYYYRAIVYNKLNDKRNFYFDLKTAAKNGNLKAINILKKVDWENIEHEFSIEENTNPSIQENRIQLSSPRKPLIILLAIFIIIVEIFLYAGIGAFLGWKHGGGILPMLILIALITFTWRKITGKNKIKKTL